MFTFVLLLAAFAIIGGIVYASTRRRPRAPLPPGRLSDSRDRGVDTSDISPYLLAGVAADEPSDAADDCASDSDNGGDCGGSDPD